MKVRSATAVIELNDQQVVSPTQQHGAHGKVGVVALNVFENLVRFVPPTLLKASYVVGECAVISLNVSENICDGLTTNKDLIRFGMLGCI